jgi:hypothetical protein
LSTLSYAIRLALALVGLAGIIAPAHALPTVAMTAPRGWTAPFSVTVDEPDGIAPHTATFSVTGGATPVASIEFDVDGNGTEDITTPGIPVAGVQVT